MMNLEQLLHAESDGTLLDISLELLNNVAPASGKAHEYCRKVNRMISGGSLCINAESHYRLVYLPTLTKAVYREMARRHVNYLMKEKK